MQGEGEGSLVVVLEEHGAGFGELSRAWLEDEETRGAFREVAAAQRLVEGQIEARGRARPWAASCWWSAARRHGRGRGQGRRNRASPLEALGRSGTGARGWVSSSEMGIGPAAAEGNEEEGLARFTGA